LRTQRHERALVRAADRGGERIRGVLGGYALEPEQALHHALHLGLPRGAVADVGPVAIRKVG